MRRLALAAALLGLLAGCGPLGSGDEGNPIFVGVLEDVVKQPDPGLADERVRLAREAGFDALGITTPWKPGQTEPDPAELQLLRNVATAAQKYKIRILLSVFQYRNRDTPTTDEEQEEFAEHTAAIARALPSIRDFVVGNEPNLNGFWFPQFGPNGEDVAAPAYTSLLATTYDALKAVSPQILVYGGALAPRGADNPEARRHTQSPTAFIRDMGQAYRESGRRKPLMDVFAIHPYLERSKLPPDTPHDVGTAIGIGDYDKLRDLLGEAFDGTAQKGSDVPIAYTEFGVQSEIPPEHQEPYTNLQSPLAVDAVDEQTQAEYYRQAFELASCQETVTGILIFHLLDEPDLNRWQSGVYYADGTPKSSLDEVREAAEKAREGKVDC
ncbi:MAG TPA: hypothetical protein VFL41_03750 [Gaiellaceae bacterium]|nr:hypothetical protein [Gaiellaceae bacterium]